MDGIGRARNWPSLTGAEWGIATTGCEAAICRRDASPVSPARIIEKAARRCRTSKRKNQVIIPKHSRNPYDFGIRMTGVEIVEVDSAEELARRSSADRTAMIYILSGPPAEHGTAQHS